MKHRFLIICYFILYWIGIINLFYWLNRHRQRILVYHHVIPDIYVNDSFEQQLVCISESQFEKQINHINKRFGVTTKLHIPNTVVITFDDGYRCGLISERILAKYKNKAYYFIPINNIDSRKPLWIDLIMAWFSYVPNGEYVILGVKYSLFSTTERKHNFSKTINNLYNNYKIEELLENLNSLYSFERLDINEEYFNYRFNGLKTDELTYLKKRGNKIGAHSENHDILSLLRKSRLHKDFASCSKLLGQIYNTSIYAYPFGHAKDVNNDVIDICGCHGFSSAVMNENTNVESNYFLPRLNISFYNNYYELEAHLSGLVQYVKRLKFRK